MKDDMLWISGWLFADLVLVLAIIFLAQAPGFTVAAEQPGPTPPSTKLTPPRITIACEPLPASTKSPVACSATNDGDPIRNYAWSDSSGSTATGEVFETSFTAAGLYRVVLAASNEGGTDKAEASVTVVEPEVGPLDCATRADFRFDQLLVRGISDKSARVANPVTSSQIANAEVSIELTKGQETNDFVSFRHEGGNPLTALEHLLKRERNGFQLALVETFGYLLGDEEMSTHRAIAVNKAFLTWVRASAPAPEAPPENLFLNQRNVPNEDWVANYVSKQIDAGTARINLYFVSGVPDCGR